MKLKRKQKFNFRDLSRKSWKLRPRKLPAIWYYTLSHTSEVLNYRLQWGSCKSPRQRLKPVFCVCVTWKKNVSALWVTWKTRILRVCHVPYTLVRVGYNIIHVSNGAASVSSYSHRSAAESWTDKEDVQPRYTPFHVLPLPRHRLAGRC